MKKSLFLVILIIVLFAGCIQTEYMTGPITGKLYRQDEVFGVTSDSNPDYRREIYVSTHPQQLKSNKDAILAGKVFMGMVDEQVRASWGQPNDINRSVGSWGTHEQWVYTRYNDSISTTQKLMHITGQVNIDTQKYLYFENGILTSWQD